jgi:hypothetical protein
MKESAYQKAYRLSHKEYYREYSKKWRTTHKSQLAKYHRKWRSKHPGYQYSANKKWRTTHPKVRDAEKRRYYRKSAWAPNRYRRWTWEEIQLILYSRLTDSKLSKKLGRSVGSIQIKRSKYNKEVNNEGESKS